MKGAKVNCTEQNIEVSSWWRGVSAVLSRRRLCVAILPVALVVLLVGGPAAAMAEVPAIEALEAQCSPASHVSVELEGRVGESRNELETTWSFAYSTVRGGPWTPVPGGQGTITKAEAMRNGIARFKTKLEGLTPETKYYVQLTARNASGTASSEAFEATSGGHVVGCEAVPFVPEPVLFKGGVSNVDNVTAVSAEVHGFVAPNEVASAIAWRYEYITVKALAEAEGRKESAAWVDGPSGTISKGEAEAVKLSKSGGPAAEGEITGLVPGTVYDVRLFAENEPEPGVHKSATSSPVGSFETSGSPVLQTFAVHSLDGEAIRVLGGVDPRNSGLNEVQLVTVGGAPAGGTFTLGLEGQSTTLPFDASSAEVRKALEGLSSVGEDVVVSGAAGGPYAVEFVQRKASSAQPLLAADGSGLTPSGTVTVAMVREGFSYPTHYHFEYVSQEQFAASGWARAASTPEREIAGTADVVEGEDLPGLRPGVGYDFRIVARNTTPGDPVVEGALQAVTVPAVVGSGGGGESAACPNESLRTGLSAQLPDCRAYEQVTPVDKEGAQEVFHYGENNEGSGALVGEDGEHVLVGSPETDWGTGAGAGQSPYFFTRTSSGWSMTAAATQPATGVDRTVTHVVLDPDLTQFGFASFWQTSAASESAMDEFKAGAPGGPYTLVASVPRKEVTSEGGWVAASEDFTTMILQVEDHTLLGAPTGTLQGEDLYEYSSGHLRQVNVLTDGATIGTCGAHIAKGEAEPNHEGAGGASRHAVSTDGSRIFFEASPGGCEVPDNLYMREADRTLDIGPYKFAAANRLGSQLLLEKQTGEVREFSLYNTETAINTPVFSIPVAVAKYENGISISEDFSAIYFTSDETTSPEAAQIAPKSLDVYRYEIGSGIVNFLFEAEFGENNHGGVSPNGQYYYFAANHVSGVPGGGDSSASEQTYRYDDDEHVVECISCASRFNPEPRLAASFAGSGLSAGIFANGAQGMPAATSFSANGDYAFFDTASALVSQDVDGEITGTAEGGSVFSPSSDVYEWRRYGLNGCVHVQGCLGLISSGQGGFKVMLLGTADEGRDVFFTDFSQLVPTDTDSAGDVYDARIGGGFPVPVKPTECEGDACSTPLAAPVDATPASLSFTGPGNPAATTTASKPATGKAKKKVAKKKTRKKRRKKPRPGRARMGAGKGAGESGVGRGARS
jgi:hypothetical protein